MTARAAHVRTVCGEPLLALGEPSHERAARTPTRGGRTRRSEGSRQAATAGQKPILTIAACAGCVLVFLGASREANPYTWDALSHWGVYPPDRIRAGAIWTYVTSVFVHLELWHVAFNVYWLWVLGSRLERALGSVGWLALFLAAAVVSSGAEFAVADSTGIGASGVVYAFFGFMVVTKGRFAGFAAILDKRTIWIFVVWLLACIAMTWARIWEVGNAAHVAGLLFGAGIGAWLVRARGRAWIAAGVVALLVAAFVPVVWAPWSSTWTGERAVRDHLAGDYRSAIHWYERSLALGGDKAWGWRNLALAWTELGDHERRAEALQMLRAVDARAADELEAELRKSGK